MDSLILVIVICVVSVFLVLNGFSIGWKMGRCNHVTIPLSYFGKGLAFTIFLSKYDDGTGVIIDPRNRDRMALVHNIPKHVEVGQPYLIGEDGHAKWLSWEFMTNH